jgi:hypothetical protein
VPASTAKERFSGRFAENVFSAEQVSGPRIQMRRRTDGTWGGLFPCKPWFSHPSNNLCPTDFDQTEIAIRMGGEPIFGLNRWPNSVVVARSAVQYEFALADARPFPPELVMPLFLAVTSARELDSGLSERSGTLRVFDTQTRLSWEIDVEGVGRISVRRNPTS